MKATIRQVAELAGVSITTVSHVLNCKEGTRVRQETQGRVLEAARKLNYHTSGSTKPHAMKRTGNLGLVIPQVAGGAYANLVTEGINRVCGAVAKAGYSLMVEAIDQSVAQYMPQMVKEGKVDGCILLGLEGLLGESVATAAKALVPVVCIDRDLPDFDCVVRDNFKGAITATNDLLGNGCGSISCLCPATGSPTAWEPVSPVFSERVDGFVLSLARSGVSDAVSCVVPVFGCSPIGALAGLLASGRALDGIVALTRELTESAIEACGALGNPGVRCIGFSDSESSAVGYRSVHIDTASVAENAVKLLLGRIQGSSLTAFRVVVKADLVDGGTDSVRDASRTA